MTDHLRPARADAPAPGSAPGPAGAADERDPRAARAWTSRDILRAAFLVALVYVALQLLWVAHAVFFLAFLGVLFGLGISAGADRLARRGVPRTLAAVGIPLTVLGLLALAGWLMAPLLSEQFTQLRGQLPQAIERAGDWVQRQQQAIFGADAPVGAQGGPLGGLGRQVGQLGQRLVSVVSSTLAAVGGVLLVLVIAIYVAAEPRLYRRGLLHLIPHAARPRAREVMANTGIMLRRWLVTQLIAMLVIGVVTTIALLLLHVPAALPLGLIAGLLEFIPLFGPILSAVPAIAMSFLDSPEKALSVALAYTAIQQVENHLLIPLLMKEGLELPPVLTILAQTTMGLVFGFIGLLVAVPLLGAVMVPIKMYYVQDVIGDDVALPGDGEGRGAQ